MLSLSTRELLSLTLILLVSNPESRHRVRTNRSSKLKLHRRSSKTTEPMPPVQRRGILRYNLSASEVVHSIVMGDKNDNYLLQASSLYVVSSICSPCPGAK